MNTMVVNLNSLLDCFISSSINNRIKKLHPESSITWLVKDADVQSLFRYTKNVRCITLGELEKNNNITYDWIINYSFNVRQDNIPVKSLKNSGVNFEKKGYFADILQGKRKTDMNIFQVYYKLAGLIWNGEGYGIKYYPKTKAHKNRVALCINHSKLKHYINDNLDLNEIKVRLIPFKKNIFKRLDEINKCKHIVTDDLLVAHLSLFLRKKVHFLQTFDLNIRLEMFGSGTSYRIPSQFIL